MIYFLVAASLWFKLVVSIMDSGGSCGSGSSGSKDGLLGSNDGPNANESPANGPPGKKQRLPGRSCYKCGHPIVPNEDQPIQQPIFYANTNRWGNKYWHFNCRHSIRGIEAFEAIEHGNRHARVILQDYQ